MLWLVTILILQRLIGQLYSHIIESFTYFTSSQCLLCNSHHEPQLTKYDRGFSE